MKINEFELAQNISNCNNVMNAMNEKAHPCYKVVNEQTKLIDIGRFAEKDRQRPEPWIGNLTKAKVLFISSNPSISDEPYLIREDFPTFDWSPEKSAEFFLNRFNQNHKPVFATFNHASEKNFLVLCKDGEYRSGMKKQKQPQSTWNSIHQRATELIGSGANPAENYALTELVHCKSKNAIGVKEALSSCMIKWFSQIISASGANVLVLVGSHVAGHMKNYSMFAGENFGSSVDYNKLSQFERAMRDIQFLKIGERKMLAIYNAHNGSSNIQKLPEVYGVKVISWLRNLIENEIEFPKDLDEIHKQLDKLFN